jgi:hypothetical protein
MFGEKSTGAVYLTRGNSVAEARENLEMFLALVQRDSPKLSPTSLGLLLPTERDWRGLPARLNTLDGFEDAFRAALARHGFLPEAFTGFFKAWRELRAAPPGGDYQRLVSLVDELATGPMALLSNLHGPDYWFLSVVDQPTSVGEPHTINVDQLQSLNGLFTRYRWSALRLSLIGLGLVIASVFAIYPFRRGVRIAMIPAGSCFFVFGVLGLAGQTLNLFHLLGAFLGVCLSHNYAIFSSENASAGAAPPVSIRLSALCTAASFGVLGFSRIPVIHALGLTVALIVLTALTVVELEPLARRTGGVVR